jgi:short subunit dehydrogenase-like uncharacterized protein
MKREFDCVLYGATGFVGKQTVAYMRQHYPELRIAVAGRDKKKLEAVAHINGLHDQDQVIVAAADAQEALDQLALRTRVVLSSAGPFALYGSGLVAACVKAKTHYVDITGETPWVKQMIDLYHAQASQDGTRIVPCCGFDSVPSDIGAFLAASEIQSHFNEPCVQVRAAFSMKGGLNGGTLASLANIMSTNQDAKAARDLFLLNPPNTRPDSKDGHQDVLLPKQDAEFNAWIGPFIMATINTRVVRRSAALYSALASSGGGKTATKSASKNSNSAYGNNFQYQEYMRFGKGAKAAALAGTFAWGLGAGAVGMQFSPIRKLALKYGPAPGQGPSEKDMDEGGFRCDYIATSASGKQLRGKMSTKGDPGNRATTKFVCESAVALIEQLNELPGGKNAGGVLTPATAFGHVLVERLRAKQTVIEFSSS